MASCLEASDSSSSDENSFPFDSMMEQDARAARARLVDVGYREGKTELVDANVNAQASFEQGVLSGFNLSQRAGQIRGMMVTLVAISEKSNNSNDESNTNDNSLNKMKQLITQLQSQSNPTELSPELMKQCEAALIERGLTVPP